MKGRQELFSKQSPQKLKMLREHAIIESAISSNRMEGVEIESKRIKTVVFGESHLQDRNEEEIRGYQKARAWIHESAPDIYLSADTVLELHRLSRGEVWDAGKLKEKDGDIIERYPDGTSRVRFRTVSARETPAALDQLVGLWRETLNEGTAPSLILLAAFNLDFLCIHPFRDGNGRVSRLLLLLQLYQLGFEVGRYISLERVIENSKDRYYETLELSSHGWHEGKHDLWPYVNYLLFVLKTAYVEFEKRVGQLASPKGAKTEIVLSAIDAQNGTFTLVDLETTCPGVSRDMIRKILKDLQAEGRVQCLGRGPGATWEKR
ncbi:MAG: Fic family protein [Verrucomicrobia bacterium]|nr:Fic family protein [Verrucomicrobiota bacterium]